MESGERDGLGSGPRLSTQIGEKGGGDEQTARDEDRALDWTTGSRYTGQRASPLLPSPGGAQSHATQSPSALTSWPHPPTSPSHQQAHCPRQQPGYTRHSSPSVPGLRHALLTTRLGPHVLPSGHTVTATRGNWDGAPFPNTARRRQDV